MEDLVEEVRESSSAAVLDGLDIVYVLRVPTHKIMRTSLGVGTLAPACSLDFHGPSAAGQPARRRTVPPRRPPCPAAHTAHTATDLPPCWNAFARRARRAGAW